MSKWDELKRLAETAISLREHGRTSEGEPEWDEADDAFWDAITPELIAELIAENKRLRQIIINSAKEVGAALSTECSLEFMERLPQEIWLVMQRQQDGADQLTAELAKLRTLSGGKR
ncbi:Uncharacterised protein [Pseudomonas luteola]|uniref:Uncharacterized protein n=1 Tax=Pseudomonas luteola TaxID=47886 RepID=A0A2X2CPJ8_PSELU|nr:hypothetical protein [Pseudomonas luteola]SPZ07556.1 Uncharacterised protein [Pseudomonas luteola]